MSLPVNMTNRLIAETISCTSAAGKASMNSSSMVLRGSGFRNNYGKSQVKFMSANAGRYGEDDLR